MSAPLLVVEDLAASVGTRVALEGRLDVASGEVVGIVGPSGAGKSIFLRAVCQLDPPAAGSCRLREQAPSPRELPRWRARVSYLPTGTKFWGARVAEDFRRAAALGVHAAKRLDEARAKDLLARIGLEGFWDADPARLSSGEQQRCALARLLWTGPDVLLLDEPTGPLDPVNVRIVEERLLEWVHEPGTERAIFWITHASDQARRCCNRWLEVDAGKVREIGVEGLPQ